MSRPRPNRLKSKLRRQLDLPRGIRRVGLHEICGQLVVTGTGGHAGSYIALYERAGRRDHAIGSNGDTLVVPVEEVERLRREIEVIVVVETDDAGKAEIGGRIIGTGKSVAGLAGQAVVKVVAVLVRIAGDGGIEGAPRTVVHHG